MLLPIGEDYGSVSFDVVFNAMRLKVKVYPRLVHALKAASAKAMHAEPQSIAAMNRRLTALERQQERLKHLPITGFRIEVTVVTPTLASARRIVRSSQALNYASYKTTRPLPQFENVALDFALCPNEVYWSNWDEMHTAAVETEVFIGRATNPTTKPEQQVMLDLNNATGWNLGRRRISLWDNLRAWWSRGSTPEPSDAGASE